MIYVTPEILERVFKRISNGETLTHICRDRDMPDRDTIALHIQKDAELTRRYEAARLFQGDVYFDQVIDIADGRDREGEEVLEDHLTSLVDKESHATIRALRFESAAVREQRIKARVYAASKLRPRKYGNNQQVEVVGDPNRPISTVTRIELVIPKMLEAPNPLPVIEQEPQFDAIGSSED